MSPSTTLLFWSGKSGLEMPKTESNDLASAVFFGDVTRFRFGCLGFPTEDFFLATLTLLASLPTDFSFPDSQRL